LETGSIESCPVLLFDKPGYALECHGRDSIRVVRDLHCERLTAADREKSNLAIIEAADEFKELGGLLLQLEFTRSSIWPVGTRVPEFDALKGRRPRVQHKLSMLDSEGFESAIAEVPHRVEKAAFGRK
jgi:hypothetical protein